HSVYTLLPLLTSHDPSAHQSPPLSYTTLFRSRTFLPSCTPSPTTLLAITTVLSPSLTPLATIAPAATETLAPRMASSATTACACTPLDAAGVKANNWLSLANAK